MTNTHPKMLVRAGHGDWTNTGNLAYISMNSCIWVIWYVATIAKDICLEPLSLHSLTSKHPKTDHSKLDASAPFIPELMVSPPSSSEIVQPPSAVYIQPFGKNCPESVNTATHGRHELSVWRNVNFPLSLIR